MGIRVVYCYREPKTRLEKLLDQIKRKIGYLIEIPCDFSGCKNTITVPKHIARKHQHGLSCSEYHAKLMLR